MDTIKPEELTIEILEHVFGEPTKEWHGRCSELAHAAAQTVGGAYAYGHYRGPVANDGHWGVFAGAPFQRHGWVTLPDGGVLDPTRWSFLNDEPFIFYVPVAHPDYDEGGQVWRNARRSPPPATDAHPKGHILELGRAATAHLNAMLLREEPSSYVNVMQAGWVASGPLEGLGDFAQEILQAIVDSGNPAAVPVDYVRMLKLEI